MSNLPNNFSQSLEISRASQQKLPIVALESTVITHGLPNPQNLALAQDMEQTVRAEGATPATIAVMDGKIQIGLSPDQLERLANARPDELIKVSLRDFATTLVQNKMGGTTVAGTMFVAQKAGIRVFATGGIGGVHKEARFDVSTDLQSLASIPMIVVCAGAKSILDLPATLEYLETMGVPVVGYGTDKFPEFFSTGKDLPVSVKLDTPEEIVKFARTHWELGMNSAVLVCQPVSSHMAIPADEISAVLAQVSQEVVEKKIIGQKVTPYELKRVNELTGGKSMRTNLDLLLNNAKLAAQIARAMVSYEHQQKVL
ncbi:MAG: pseudouridine-5'-phosphate glycosidase [Chloroflexi bacterium]|nr:pseudouridine-5'-phosphate glycosidase [Chloroflexota bacterium]